MDVSLVRIVTAVQLIVVSVMTHHLHLVLLLHPVLLLRLLMDGSTVGDIGVLATLLVLIGYVMNAIPVVSPLNTVKT